MIPIIKEEQNKLLTGEIGLHYDLPGNVCRQNLTLGTHEKIYILQNVQKELVPTVLDAFSTPTDLTGYLGRDLSLLLFRSRLDTLLGNERLQHAGICILWIAKIQNFCRRYTNDIY